MIEGTNIALSIDELSSIYVSAVTFVEKVIQSTDNVVTDIKKMEESGIMEGKNGESLRETYSVLTSVVRNIANNAQTMSKFIDDKIGKTLERNSKDAFANVSDKAKELLKRRLKK